MTGIQWTDETWNVTTGCDKVSPGCGLPRFPGDDTGGCYAMAMAKRLKGMGQAKYQNDGAPKTSGPGFGFTMHESALTLPMHWRKPRKVFVDSMSDLFHQRATREFITRVFAVMAATPEHTYQILTKRPGKMRSIVSRGEVGTAGFFDDVECAMAEFTHAEPAAWPLPNVWLGTSIESDEYCWRADELRRTPAAIKFLSLEPLLGPLPSLDLAGIDWVILGGESGPGARSMEFDWARSLLQQCQAAQVPVFVKQLGSIHGRVLGGGNGGDPDFWPADLRVREFPTAMTS